MDNSVGGGEVNLIIGDSVCVCVVCVSVLLGSTCKQEDGYGRFVILKILMSHQSARKAIIE